MAKPVKRPVHNTRMGPLGIDVFANPTGDGGRGVSRADGTGRVTLVVGTKGSWERTVEILTHEAFEMAATLRRLRYHKDDNQSIDSDGSTFIMSHQEMQDTVEDIAPVIMTAMPFLRKEWLKLRKGLK